ncbi:hypothetical protein [Paracoccus salsus]|uniref:hypothetical protein n=1 Tax=Paracoccus salsus TaxID=2911061 RepID=UPI001F45D5AA|nr:hypothetical protein [Paracoccus salsus]
MASRHPDPEIMWNDANDYQAAVIADHKISEFVRLDLPGLLAPATGAMPCPVPLPPPWRLDRLKEVRSFSDLLKEIANLKAKIEAALKVMQPPGQNLPNMPIIPPRPPTPGTTALRQILEVLTAAGRMAEDGEPEQARDSLKEAKGMMHDEEVKAEFRRIRDIRLWYDILEELRDAIGYLDSVSKP